VAPKLWFLLPTLADDRIDRRSTPDSLFYLIRAGHSDMPDSTWPIPLPIHALTTPILDILICRDSALGHRQGLL
jgi:hypothetical protein